MTRAFEYIGLQVKTEIAGRVFLGDVIDARPTHNKRGDFSLTVRHFNGEPWPFDPLSSSVTILERADELNANYS